MDPVQFYNHVPDVPPPFYSNTTQANQSVNNLIMLTDEGINKAAGIFAANIGDNPNVQSGVAIREQIDRGNNGTAWVFEALEQSIERVCELLVRAIPKTYDGTREVVLTQDDGSLETMIINQPVIDNETGETIYLHDLTQGQYDVVVDVGAGYKNRQKEAVDAFERLAQADPALMEIGRDIHLGNIEAPNMDKIAERARALMLQQGMIPEEQMTEEELAQLQQAQAQAANQPQQPDAETIKLQIEQLNAQTAQMDQQNRAQELQVKLQELQIKYQGQQEKTQSDLALNSAKIDQEQQKIDMRAEEMLIKAQQEQSKQQAEMFRYMQDMALKMTELEQSVGRQLNGEVQDNLLVFNPETGDFE